MNLEYKIGLKLISSFVSLTTQKAEDETGYICEIKKFHPGKIYQLITEKTLSFIIDDGGGKFLFVDGLELYSDYFISLDQWREKQPLKIGL